MGRSISNACFLFSFDAGSVSLSGPEWGTEVNEPGGRLFGEAIRGPGERRQLGSWEIPLYVTMGIATLMVTVGLSSRPPTSAKVRPGL